MCKFSSFFLSIFFSFKMKNKPIFYNYITINSNSRKTDAELLLSLKKKKRGTKRKKTYIDNQIFSSSFFFSFFFLFFAYSQNKAYNMHLHNDIQTKYTEMSAFIMCSIRTIISGNNNSVQ